jgi:hypothetical protein
VEARILKLTQGTPFTIISVVIGNIQYPQTVADSVANKLAATQSSRTDHRRNPDCKSQGANSGS